MHDTTARTRPRFHQPAFFNAATRQACFAGYELLRRISWDKADEIFLARRLDDPVDRRRFALKRWCSLHQDASRAFDAFTVESQLLASMEHPSIPPLVDFGALDGWYYLALELPPGHDLAWIQSVCLPQGERLPVELTVHIGREISDALTYLHEMQDARGEPLGLSHQDIRPGNIFITDDGRVKLLPFGIARSYRMEGESSHGWLGRRRDYQSPEQQRGVVDDPRSDIYALGVVLRDLVYRRSREPENQSRVPAALRAIIRRAMEAAPERRYQSARDLTIDLLLLIRTETSWRPRERLALWMALWDARATSARSPAPRAEAPTRKILETTAVTRIEPIRRRPSPSPRPLARRRQRFHEARTLLQLRPLPGLG